jgi:hypothetical protein
MKFAIDTQIATTLDDTPIASSITLGSEELPFLLSQKSYGQLNILSNSFQITITTQDNDGDTFDDLYGPYTLGTIEYKSSNAYFIDQSFIYETGALIISQSDGDLMSIKPSFNIEDTGSIVLTLNLVDVQGISGKVHNSGYGSTAIMTEYSSPPQEDTSAIGIKTIEITSSYVNSWEIFMDALLQKELDSGDYVLTPSGDILTIDFNTYPDLVLKIENIDAQIGPGWTE